MALPVTITDLPLDVLTRVLHHTLAGDAPSARQHTRYNFALVCDTFSRVVRLDLSWLDVFGTEGMIRTVRRVVSDSDRDKVRRVYLQLASTLGKGKSDHFVNLMVRLSAAVEVEFLVSETNLRVLNERQRLLTGLRGLRRLKHLSIGPYKQRALPLFHSSILGLLLPRLRRLRTISLKGQVAWSVSRTVTNPGMFYSLSHLHTLTLDTIDTDCDRILTNLPSSVRKLVLSHPDRYIQDNIALNLASSLASPTTGAAQVNGRPQLQIRHITTLVLHDPPVPGGLSCPVRTRDRFASLFRRMTHLESLTCAPSAVGELKDFAALSRLRELELVEDRAQLEPALDHSELVVLLGHGRPKKVSVDASISRNWSGQQQGDAEDSAGSNGVELVWK